MLSVAQQAQISAEFVIKCSFWLHQSPPILTFEEILMTSSLGISNCRGLLYQRTEMHILRSIEAKRHFEQKGFKQVQTSIYTSIIALIQDFNEIM